MIGAGRRLLTFAGLASMVASACSAPILANDPLVFPPPPAATAGPSLAPDPMPIAFPRDDGPHDRLTEWWYYTGHLQTAAGRRFGFEAVVFRAERGSVPAAWAAHLALTDEQGGAFHYAQRSEVGSQVDRSPRDALGAPTGFDLQIGGLSPTLTAAGAPATAAPWRLAGSGGTDQIEAALAREEIAAAGGEFGLHLDLESTKPAALHDDDGFISFGSAGSSYYYSRTRMNATGTLQLDGEQLSVDGIAWFDHQWGDFVSVGGGGWDWFAINLDNGTDLTFSHVLDANGSLVLAYGTVVNESGTVVRIPGDAFTILNGADWTSPNTGRTYPQGWIVGVPSLFNGLSIQLVPTVANQELETRATTGVAYWEGSQHVRAFLGPPGVAREIGGEGYVEITRYGD